jgi:biotin carboxyl carrier protein
VKIKNNTPFQAVVNGQTYDVAVENVSATPLVVTVNGMRYEVQFVGDETAVTAPAPVVRPAPVAQPASAPVIAAPAGAAGANSVVAPMPGTIQGICVKAGQVVKYGDQLCLLEAMKMKNAIRAPKDGVIASVECQDDQRVVYGSLLFTLK